MKILAIDTATDRCSVALRLDDGETDSLQGAEGVQSGQVLEMIRRLMGQRNLRYGDLDLLAVDVGPGSFTGLRVGIGVAQGLAFSSGLPLAGIGSLAAMSRAIQGRAVITALDARMQQVYWGAYRDGKALISPRVDDPASIGEELEILGALPEAVAVGDGWSVYRELMPRGIGSTGLEMSGPDRPDASRIAGVAATMPDREWCSPLAIRAAYVRNRVAEKARDRR